MASDDQTRKPFRAAIKALWREFRRCSQVYPPLYHEQMLPWCECSLQGNGLKIREAFRKAYEHLLTVEWQEWDGPEDVSYFGRFTGSGNGLDEFRRLAESAYLVACEIDTQLPERKGYHGWLEVIHEMADGYPMPLLRSVLKVWVLGAAPEEELKKCGQSEDGTVTYPLYPFHRTLVHSVFTSSMAALEVMADEDRGLLVGDERYIRGYDFQWLDGTATSSEATEETAEDDIGPDIGPDSAAVEDKPEQPAVESAATEQPQYIFRFEGTTWHLRFVDGDDVEEGHFRDMPGFHHYAKLLANPGEVFAFVDMKFFGKAKQRERPTQVALETMDGFQRDDGEHSEPMLDEKGVATLRKRRHRLEENVEIAKRLGDTAKIEEAEKALTNFQLHARKQFDVFRRVRTFGPSEKEKARKRVPKALKDCCVELMNAEPPLVKLKQHLEDCEDHEFGTIWYSSSPPIRWQTDRPS